MTDVYIYNTPTIKNHKTIFIGHPLTGGYFLIPFANEKYAVLANGRAEWNLQYIRQFPNLRPVESPREMIEDVEAAINRVVQEIEKLGSRGKTSSPGVTRETRNLLALLN